MKKNYINMLIIAACLLCTNAWGVAIYCTDNQVAGTGTMVHDFYLDASDWSYGTLDPAVLFDGPNNFQVFNTYLSLYFTPPYLRYLMSSPEVGYNWTYGNGTTGTLVPGPGGGYVPLNTPPTCSHPKYFPEPDITSFNFAPTSVYVGQKFKAFWVTSGDPVSCNVDGTAGYPKQSLLGEEFTATIGMDGSHTMICINDWGISFPVYANLTVNECPPEPSSVSSVSYNSTIVSPGSNFGKWDDSELSRNFEAYCSGSQWKIKLTSAVVDTVIGVDMHGVTEVDAGVINSTNSCNTLNNMISSLDFYSDAQGPVPGVITPPTAWYIEDAFLAHEELHGTKYQTSFNNRFPSVKAAYETFPSIPIDSASNSAEALDLIYNVAAFDDAEGVLYTAQLDAFDDADHPPWAQFNAAQHVVSDYWKGLVQSRKSTLSCP